MMKISLFLRVLNRKNDELMRTGHGANGSWSSFKEDFFLGHHVESQTDAGVLPPAESWRICTSCSDPDYIMPVVTEMGITAAKGPKGCDLLHPHSYSMNVTIRKHTIQCESCISSGSSVSSLYGVWCFFLCRWHRLLEPRQYWSVYLPTINKSGMWHGQMPAPGAFGCSYKGNRTNRCAHKNTYPLNRQSDRWSYLQVLPYFNQSYDPFDIIYTIAFCTRASNNRRLGWHGQPGICRSLPSSSFRRLLHPQPATS